MSDFFASGQELKKLVQLAKKKPLPFAFNPGPSEDETVFAIDRKKQPKFLSKAAKAEGAGNKTAYGTMSVDKKVATLACEKTLPGMAKKLKKWFKSQKTPLNFVILDENGAVLEEDIEDLGPDEDEDDDELQAELEDDGGVAAAEAEEDEADDEDDDEEAPAAGDPRLARLKEAVEATRNSVVALPESDARPKLLAAVGMAAKQAESGEVEAAAATLGKIRDAMASLGGAADAASSPDQQKWEQARGKVEAPVLAALSLPTGDPTKLRALWLKANEVADQGNPGSALKALPMILQLVKAAQASAAEAPDSGADDDTDAAPAAEAPVEAEKTGPSVVAFQRSRIMWLDAKRAIQRELVTLQNEILAQASGEDDESDIRAAANEIAGRFDLIDSRLEDILDDITNAEPGKARNSLTSSAQSVIREYTALLDSPMFSMLDSNPFKNVAVTGPAKQSLATIARTLS